MEFIANEHNEMFTFQLIMNVLIIASEAATILYIACISNNKEISLKRLQEIS